MIALLCPHTQTHSEIFRNQYFVKFMNVAATETSQSTHRWKIALSILIVVIVLPTVGLYGSRHYLIEYFLSDQLNKLGYPLQSVQTYDLSVDQLYINGLIAGNDQELRLNEVRVNWNWRDLLQGKMDALIIDGLQIKANLDQIITKQDASNSQSVSRLDEKNIRIPWLPVLSMKNVSLDLQYGDQSITILISGETESHKHQQTNIIHLDISAFGSLGQIKTNVQATLDTQGNMQGQVIVSNGMLNLPQAKITSFSGDALFKLTAFTLEKAEMSFVFKGIQQQSLPVDFPLQDLKIDELAITGNLRKEKESLHSALDLAFKGGEFSAESLRFIRTSLSLPLNIKKEKDIWQINLRQNGQIDLSQMRSEYPVFVKEPLSIAITQVNIELEKHGQGISFKHDISIKPKKISAIYQEAGSRNKKAMHEMQLDSAKIILNGKQSIGDLYRGNILLNDAVLNLPNNQLKLSGISTQVYINDSTTNHVVDFTIPQVKHLSPTPIFVPLSISGNITHQTGKDSSPKYLLNLTGGTQALRYLKINGEHTLKSGDGFLTLHIAPMKFSTGQLQPAQLFPALTAIEDVNGQINGKANIRWSKKGIVKSSGSFAANNLSLTHNTGMKISGLNTQLNLKSLLPIQSEARQKLAIQAIGFGTPIKDFLISYQMNARHSPQVFLDQMRFLILDGEVSIDPTVIHLSPSGISYVNAKLDNIDLNTFFNWIEVDGLSGDGRLSGKIPLILKKEGILIVNGQLAAKTPGTLRFQSQKVTELLANKGIEVDLFLQAIEDFRYKELTLNLDKSETHDLHAKLSVLGNNPDVKDGHDFRLNIQLESKIDKLLKAIQQGLLFSNKVLRDSFMH